MPELISCAEKRHDSWGEQVLLRIRSVSDLVAPEGKYHRGCLTQFRGRQTDGERGRPCDMLKEESFQKLCLHLDENDECQYSLSELSDIYESYMEGAEGYSVKWLRQKLQARYGDQMIITSIQGISNIVTFRDKGHKVLRDNWVAEQKANVLTEKNRIIDMAASIIRDDIRTHAYNCAEYPTMESTNNGNSLVPESISRFLHGIIKSTALKEYKSIERRCTAISHSIIAACRPKSFVSPILLAVAVYIHRKYASRELIDILSSMGFADDYKEIQRLNYAFLSKDEPSYNLKRLHTVCIRQC